MKVSHRNTEYKVPSFFPTVSNDHAMFTIMLNELFHWLESFGILLVKCAIRNAGDQSEMFRM